MGELPPLYDYPTAAEYLHCSERSLRRWVSEKRIDCSRIGRQVMFTQENLTDFVERCAVPARRY